MLTHVVLFTLADPDHAEETAARLRSLEGRVPTLRAIEVGVDVLPSERSAHVALITRFDDEAGLDAYRIHPAHQDVVSHIRRVAVRSVKVDYRG